MKDSQIIESLLENEIIRIDFTNEITFASGIQSNIYCDLRKIIGYVDLRQVIVDRIIEKINLDDVDVIAGTATAGIPWSAFVGWSLKKPVCYVRSQSKDHGKKIMIEGSNVENKNVVLIEDMITTGTSVINAANELRKANVKNVFVISIFSYDFNSAKANFEKEKIEHTPVFKIDLILNHLEKKDFYAFLKIKKWIDKING